MKLYGPLDMHRSEVRNAITQNLAAAPTGPSAGLRYFDTVLGVERYYNGAAWVNLSDTIDVAKITGLGSLATLNSITSAYITNGTIANEDISGTAAIALSKLATDPLARANHTGTQGASTISDFDSQVRTSRLDQMAQPNTSVSMNNQQITNLATPNDPADAATMAYVDSVAQGLDIKGACRVASTESVDLSGVVVYIDGAILTDGDRVLLKDQADAAENGIYEYVGATPTLVRASDADTSAKVHAGMFTFVAEGNANADKGYVLTTNDPITLDVTDLVFTQFSGSGTVIGTAARIVVTGNQVDIAATYVGQSSITTLGTVTTGTWSANAIAVNKGGTGATSAPAARTNLGAITKYTTTIGNGSDKSFTVTHSLNATAIGVELWETATGLTVYADVTRTNVNTVTIDGFTSAPATNAISVVVWG